MHLLSLKYNKPKNIDRYPFNLPILNSLNSLEFKTPVTIFVGENGSGKSTLIEGIAAEIGSITVGGESISYDPSMKDARTLAKQLNLIWSIRTRRGFFLRSEDFITYTKRISMMREELEEDLKRIDEEYKDKSKLTKSYARMAAAGSLNAIKNDHGEGLEKKSHGESFLELFKNRFIPNGLYLLDEPEVPLSPMNQLVFISLINQMVEENGQFIIATHSPILMGIPNSTIYSFDEDGINEVKYNELEHVIIMKNFVNNPDSYLKYL